MITKFQTQALILKPFIKNYLVVESCDGAANRVLPDTSLVIAFKYSGEIDYTINGDRKELGSTVISGLKKSSRIINYAENSGAILVIFKETGTLPFFKVPAHELFDDSVSLDNFINHQILSEIEDALAAVANHLQRIALIEKFLISQLKYPNADHLVLAAVQSIELNKGQLNIKSLAHQLNISQDAFEKRFRKVAGTSPKQFSSIIRMKSLIDMGDKSENFTELAYRAGYFDQAHFNKDFRLFTGQTPTEFFRLPIFW